MMKIRWTMFGAMMGLFAAAYAADPSVTVHSVAQRAGTKMVDITYSATDPDGDELNVTITVKDGETVVDSFSGSKGSNQTVSWNAGAAWSNSVGSLTFHVVADDTQIPTSLFVPSDGSTVYFTPPIAGVYHITVSGVWIFGQYVGQNRVADALGAFDDPANPDNPANVGWVLIEDVKINKEYSPDHIYTTTVVSDGSTISFRMYDTGYSDNSGFLNAVIIQTNEFQLISGSFTWHEAKADAEARGGHLATFTSQEEWSEMVDQVGDDFDTSRWWFGATDEEIEGVWEWVTGEIWSFSYWGSEEPNNNGNQDYIETLGVAYNHKWDDGYVSGSSITGYILEVE